MDQISSGSCTLCEPKRARFERKQVRAQAPHQQGWMAFIALYYLRKMPGERHLFGGVFIK